MTPFSESAVEEASLAWLESLGYAVEHGSEIAAGEPMVERDDPGYPDVVAKRRLYGALRSMVACRELHARAAGNLTGKVA